MVTDDADEAVDFLLTGRPLLHCCRRPSAERRAGSATTRRDGACPARVPRRSTSCAAALDTVFEPPDAEQAIAYARAVDLAFAHTDDLVGWRLVERIRRQYVDV